MILVESQVEASSGDFTRESKLDSFATGAAHMSIYLDALLKELETTPNHRVRGGSAKLLYGAISSRLANRIALQRYAHLAIKLWAF